MLDFPESRPDLRESNVKENDYFGQSEVSVLPIWRRCLQLTQAEAACVNCRYHCCIGRRDEECDGEAPESLKACQA